MTNAVATNARSRFGPRVACLPGARGNGFQEALGRAVAMELGQAIPHRAVERERVEQERVHPDDRRGAGPMGADMRPPANGNDPPIAVWLSRSRW